MFWVLVWRLPGTMFCALTQAVGFTWLDLHCWLWFLYFCTLFPWSSAMWQVYDIIFCQLLLSSASFFSKSWSLYLWCLLSTVSRCFFRTVLLSLIGNLQHRAWCNNWPVHVLMILLLHSLWYARATISQMPFVHCVLITVAGWSDWRQKMLLTVHREWRQSSNWCHRTKRLLWRLKWAQNIVALVSMFMQWN